MVPDLGALTRWENMVASDNVHWSCFQYEESTGGNMHVQGCIVFKTRRTLQHVSQLLAGVSAPTHYADYDYYLEATPPPTPPPSPSTDETEEQL